MAKRTDRAKAAALAAGGGAALLPVPGPDQSQPFGVYYDRFGTTYHLPTDSWSVHHYGTRRNNPLSQTPPAKKTKRPEVAAVGTLDNWDWSMVEEGNPAKATDGKPVTTTYYTKDGTAIEGLLADPESMLRYINEIGLSLTPPKEAS